MPRYLPRSVIRKVIFWSGSDYTFNEDSYQALLPCRDHFAADAMCDFRSLSAFLPNILYRALTEIFVCHTLVFAGLDPFFDRRRFSGEQHMAALPCVANCASLQIGKYHREFFDANGALEWLLGTHAAADVKHLSVGHINDEYWQVFLIPLVAAIEQQFIHATTAKSFNVELRCFVWHRRVPAVGTTRELENVATSEQLKIEVDTGAQNPGLTITAKVTIQRKPTA